MQRIIIRRTKELDMYDIVLEGIVKMLVNKGLNIETRIGDKNNLKRNTIKDLKLMSSNSNELQIQAAHIYFSKLHKRITQEVTIQKKEQIVVRENEWCIGEDNKSYIINTAGCGAVKIFVNGENENYFLIFHSFGNEESKGVGRQIGDYIVSQEEKPESINILNIQPYGISSGISESINEINKMIRTNGDIKITNNTVCLNNINCEKYTKFINIDLEGTHKEICDRYDHLILKDMKMSQDNRRTKIDLFIRLPSNVKTPEFIKKWANFTLEEAKKKVDEITRKRNIFIRILNMFKSCFRMP